MFFHCPNLLRAPKCWASPNCLAKVPLSAIGSQDCNVMRVLDVNKRDFKFKDVFLYE